MNFQTRKEIWLKKKKIKKTNLTFKELLTSAYHKLQCISQPIKFLKNKKNKNKRSSCRAELLLVDHFVVKIW